MTEADLQEMFRMVKEIHSHLGLDGRKIVSMQAVKEQARKDVLKWREKKSIRRHERETP